MIDEKATFEQFGYYSTDLTQQSGKRIIAVCDGCGKIRELPKAGYHALCNSCAHKGKKHHFYGKPRSESTRRKISEAQKGRTASEESRKNISEANKGEKHPMYGKHHSDETRRKMSEAQKGEKSSNWKGGVSFGKYCHKFNFGFKEEMRDKYGRKCFWCGKTEIENGKRLSVHHTNLNKNCGCDGDFTCQFVPLCASCHSKVHSSKVDWEKAIIDKMRCRIDGWYI